MPQSLQIGFNSNRALDKVSDVESHDTEGRGMSHYGLDSDYKCMEA